ncbi:WD40-repeat-containing domain protein [Cokeromyces recurvatus]|uniref:WD40-repeat-containing domain protein n=1 Tax=Cokeromyces recurvatus TaxID=90255 RepID=UPI0022211302|nr:WD40-repeat-containing domain protein [Cokeromyces recurvatus]KAI7898032.1 WD40-repeat-containing domain protein [Cokeromyces recurvatus]
MTRKEYKLKSRMFAWYPGQVPMIVTSTLNNNVSELELFELDKVHQLQKISHQVNVKSRFSCLTWGSEIRYPLGIIAGGLETGELELWNPSCIISKNNQNLENESLIMRKTAHSGTIKALDFNKVQTSLLASVGNHSEVFIWDLNHSKPYTPGARSDKMNDINSVAWNSQVQHIIATSSTNGYTVLWDLRSKKQIMTLTYKQNSPISSIAWHPDIATQIVMALDHQPLLILWDLRRPHTPEKTLEGHHTTGILNVSWCQQDSDLLISTAKDGHTLGWNPNTGHFLGELYHDCNKATWCPQQPDLIATCSLDGLMNVFSIHETSLVFKHHPPKWFRRPIGASFGFGGKITTFHKKGTVKIQTMTTDPEVVKCAEQLDSVTSIESIETFIRDRLETSLDDDKEDWTMLRMLLTDHPREEILRYLGFDKEKVKEKVISLINKINNNKEKKTEPWLVEEQLRNKQRISLFSHFEQVSQQHHSFKESNHHHLHHLSKELKVEELITQTMILGDFSSAVNICFATGRYSDALLLAMCGGQELFKQTQEAYFQRKQQYDTPSYIHLLKHLFSLDTNTLNLIVLEADIDDWRSVLALLCTYAPAKEFNSLCDIFAHRLKKNQSPGNLFIYLLASNFEQVTRIWLDRFKSSTDKELQALIEKITIYRKLIDFEDYNLTSSANEPPMMMMEDLYQTYFKYSEMMVMQGKFDIALKYIQLIPTQFNTLLINKDSNKMDRIYRAAFSSKQFIEPIILRDPYLIQSTNHHTSTINTPLGNLSDDHDYQQQPPSSAVTTRTAYYSAH